MSIDKRCKYKIRENKDFYLFIKHKKSHIYYAYFPAFCKTISTGEILIRNAYKKANVILNDLKSNTYALPFHRLLLSIYDKDKNKKYYNVTVRLSKMLGDVKTLEDLTLARLVKLQKQLLDTGISGSTVNKDIGCLKKLFINREYNPFNSLSNVKHTVEKRGSFPLFALRNLMQKIDNKYMALFYIGVVTGMRRGEFETAKFIDGYVQINGTKTENAIRKVPASDFTKKVWDEYHDKWNTKDWRIVIKKVAPRLGFNEQYVTDNNIVFHCCRKTFKTILESANVNPLWIETWIGHSLNGSNDISKRYFSSKSADDSLVYKHFIDAMEYYL